MSARPPRSRRLPKVAFVLVLTAMAGVILYAIFQNSDWKIPEGAKSLKNPVVTSPDALRAARDLYRDECAHCHGDTGRSEEHTSELQSRGHLVCRLLLEKKKTKKTRLPIHISMLHVMLEHRQLVS